MGYTPIRECILCRGKFNKNELLRIVKGKNFIALDENQKKDGRGAYICSQCRNSDDLIKKRVLDRSFKQRISDEIYDLLKGERNG